MSSPVEHTLMGKSHLSTRYHFKKTIGLFQHPRVMVEGYELGWRGRQMKCRHLPHLRFMSSVA